VLKYNKQVALGTDVLQDKFELFHFVQVTVVVVVDCYFIDSCVARFGSLLRWTCYTL